MPRHCPLADLRTVHQCLSRHGDHADRRAASSVQRRRRRLEGGTTRPNVIDQNHALGEFNTGAYGEDTIHHPSPFSTTERVQRRYRPRSLEEWHQ